MADQVTTSILEGRNIKFVDNGDGTFSLATAGSGSGGSSAVTIANGADSALGAKEDTAATTDTGTFSLIALFKRLLQKITAGILTQPFTGLVGSIALTLVGASDQIDQNEYSTSLTYSLGSTQSGEILSVELVSYETGTGSVQAPQCELHVFTANPASTAGDTTLSQATWRSHIGAVQVAAADWLGDTNGKAVYKITAIPFSGIGTMYFVLKNLGSSINDAANDDEIFELRVIYRRDS